MDITIIYENHFPPPVFRHGAFGELRNCANCSFSFGDYRRDTRGGITTSFSRKKKKKKKWKGRISLVDLIRSLPLDAFLYFLVDLSNSSLFFLFFLVQKKKKRFYSSVVVLFPLLSSSYFVARQALRSDRNDATRFVS